MNERIPLAWKELVSIAFSIAFLFGLFFALYWGLPFAAAFLKLLFHRYVELMQAVYDQPIARIIFGLFAVSGFVYVIAILGKPSISQCGSFIQYALIGAFFLSPLYWMCSFLRSQVLIGLADDNGLISGTYMTSFVFATAVLPAIGLYSIVDVCRRALRR